MLKTIGLAAALLLFTAGVNAAPREVQFGCDAPVIGNIFYNPLAALSDASQTNAARRLRVTWFFNGMSGDMEDSGTMLYDRKTHTLAYYLDFFSFGTDYRKSYVFSNVNDATLRQAAAHVRTLARAELSYPNNFVDVLLRYGARKQKRFDVVTPPKP